MRRSAALWRTRPAAKSLGAAPVRADVLVSVGEARRWDSERRRRSSRSWASREGASSGRVVEEDLVEAVAAGDGLDRADWSGGREDCE